MRKKIWIFFAFTQLLPGAFSIVSAQKVKYTIKGIVLNEQNALPVEFATVLIQDQKKKTLTNEKGEFSLELPKPGDYMLLISAPDLQSQIIKVSITAENPSQTLSVTLKLKQVKSAAIDITGRRDIQKIARQTMKQEEIKEIPATQGDSINALSSFAGIDQISFLAGLGPLIIRGADAFSNRYYIDGIPVNSVQHLLGLHSVIHNDMIEKIDVYSSAAPARFGNSALGGVIEINTIDTVKKFGGRVELGILSANGALSAPILRDSKNPDSSAGYWFVAGRYGYLTALMPPILKALNSETPSLPQYYDYQAKGKYYFNKENSLTLTLIGFGDSIDNSDNPGSSDTRAKSIADGADPFSVDIIQKTKIYTNIQSLAHTYSPSEKFVNTFKAYSALNQTERYLNDTNANAPSWIKDLSTTSNPNIFGIKDDLLFKLFNNISSTRIGAELTYYDFTASGKVLVPREQFVGGAWSQFSFTESMFDVATVDQHAKNPVYSTYLEETVEYGGLTVSGGVRGDYFQNDSLYSIDPKGFVSYEFPSHTILSLAAGTYGSIPQTNYIWFSQAPEAATITGVEIEKAYHRVAGIEQSIADIVGIKIEGFYNTFDHLFQPAAGITVNGNPTIGINSGERSAYGVEITIKKEKIQTQNDFFGWINYTYMEGKQKTGLPLSYDSLGDQWINNEFVRNHSLKIIAGYKFGDNTLGARFRLMSSLPYTPIVGDDGDPFGIGRFGPVYGDRFSEFFPMYHQLDIRFSRSSATKWGRVSWYIEIQNVYNNHYPVLNWKYNEPFKANVNPTVDTSQGFGILPSFGVEISF